MEPPGSTLTDRPGAGKTRLRQMAAWILDRSQIPHQELAALLIPMVRRAVRTERGPAALVSWLRQCPGSPAVGDQTERVATLASDLARLLTDLAGSPADTLDDL